MLLDELTISPLSLLATSPGWLAHDLYGTPLWAWLALPLIAALAFVAARIAGKLTNTIAARQKEDSKWKAFVLFAQRPAQFCAGIILFHLCRMPLPLSQSLDGSLHHAELTAGTIGMMWLMVRLAGASSRFAERTLDRTGRSHAKAVVPLLRKVLQAAVILFGIVFLLQNLGVNVGAVLAGLGIGGLALALASKQTVEDLFAGVTLVVDQPARVGDFCKFGTSAGTIEDIGIRSTRIRTLDRTLVTIPNAKFCDLQIENVAMRDRILLKTVIGLDYGTKPDQMRKILETTRTLLDGRHDIAAGSRVRFVEFTESALNLEVFAYVTTRDMNEFLKAREEIFLSMMDIVSEAGTTFAAPSPPVVLQSGDATAA